MEYQENKKKGHPILKFIFASLAVIFLLYLIDWGFLKNEITAYTVWCKHLVNADSYYRCNNPEYTLRYTRYKVNPGRQEVLGWVEGFDPDRYTNCAVRSRTDWKCTYNDGSATFGFNNGKYFNYTIKESSTNDLLDHEYAVSRIQYLKLQWFPEINR